MAPVTFRSGTSLVRALRLTARLFSVLLFANPGRAAVVLQIGNNFTAATYGVDSTALPPDAALGVGTNHLVVLIYGRFSVFSKSPPARLQTMTDTAFWTNTVGLTLPPGTGISDPRVSFDTASQRWFASMIDFDSSNADNRFLLAVSATADPTGTWRGVAFIADPVNGDFADFPTFGIDANAVYLAGDMFDFLHNAVGPLLVSIPKSGLLANPPNANGRTSFGVLGPGNYGEVLQPVVSLGGASSSEVVLAVGDLGFDQLPHSNLVSFAVQNASSSGTAKLGSPATIPIPAYFVAAPINIPQSGAAAKNIDGGDARLSAIVYRIGDVLYATHSTQVSTRTAVQWFKINTLTRNVIDTGIIADPVLDLYYPAIAANTNGTVALAFNGSSATNYVSSYAVLGEPINGKLSFGSLVLLKAGSASYHPSATAQNPSRWGDYSALSLDPANPTHFWTLTMYPSSTSAWSLQITEIIAAPLLLSINRSGTNVLLSWPGAASGYQPQSTPILSSSTWIGLQQNVVLANNQFSVSVPTANNSEFFRLKK